METSSGTADRSSSPLRVIVSTKVPDNTVLVTLLALAMFSSLLQLTPLPEIVSIAIAVPSILLFGLVAVFKDRRLEVPRFALLWYLSIWLIYLPHAVSPSLNQFTLIRIPVFMTAAFVLLFVVPQTIPVRRFFSVVFYISGSIAVIGLVAPALGLETIFGFSILVSRGVEQLPLLDVSIDPLTSILKNPNPLGKVTAFGAIAGLFVVERRRNWFNATLLALTVLTLLLTWSRGALLAFLGGVVMYAAFRGNRGFALGVASTGTVAVGYAFTTLYDLLPDPLGLSDQFLYGRKEMWAEAVNALGGHDLFGVGFQPLSGVVGTNNVHSAYVFVLLSRGIIGFLVHVGFLGLVLRRRLFAPVNSRSAVLLGMYTALLITMLFDQAGLFGFAFNAVWPQLIVGYSLFPSGE